MSISASSPAQVLRLLAAAKINLHLRIGPRRNDGFHPLLSWMVTVGLFDTLSLTKAGAASRAGIDFSCDDPTLPSDGRNLVVRAAESFLQMSANSKGKDAGYSGEETPPPLSDRISIVLQKRIPSGGGLGGGSSDAARTLQGLNYLWGQDADRTAHGTRCLSELGSSLGSDVPFFLFGASSICKGRGDEVLPIPSPAIAKWVTLMLPAIAMPTADVYRRFDEMGLGRAQDVEIEPDWHRWVSLSSDDLLPLLVNDLEAPAFSLRPELSALRQGIERSLNRIVRMSGSGSSLFTLFDQREEAIEAAEFIGHAHHLRAIAVELAPTIEDDLEKPA